jgi:hypothetical protein
MYSYPKPYVSLEWSPKRDPKFRLEEAVKVEARQDDVPCRATTAPRGSTLPTQLPQQPA